MSLNKTLTSEAAGKVVVEVLQEPLRLAQHDSLRCFPLVRQRFISSVEKFGLAARGLVTCDYKSVKLEDINDVFNEMKAGTIKGRVVLQM